MARNRRVGKDQGQRVGRTATQGAGTNIGEGGFNDTQTTSKTTYSTASGENQQASRFEIPSEYRGGWLLEMAARVWGRTSNQAVRLCMWADDAEGGGLLFQSPTLIVPEASSTYGAWTRYFPSASEAIRLEAGKRYWMGFWSQITHDRYFRINTGGSDPRGRIRLSGVAQSWTGFAYEDDTLCTDFFYQQNAIPSKPAWVAPTAGQIFNSSEPVLTGTMPHNNGDGDFDYTQRVHVQIWRNDTGAMLYDSEFEPTPAEKSAKRWSRSLLALPAAVDLKARFRHQDSWGSWSNDFSSTITFQVAQGPDAPIVTAPTGKWNFISTFNYAGVYNHVLNLQSNAIQIQVLNATGTQVIYDSGTVLKVVNPGAAWTHLAWHAALQWGTNYIAAVRFRSRNAANTADVWGPYTQSAFKTNSAPYKPQNLSPTGGVQSGTTTLSATSVDPDGDPLTAAEVELFDITSNAAVTLTNTPAVSGTQIILNAAPNLVADRVYRWRTRGTDGIVYGEWSDWQTWTYRAAPVVTWSFPTPGLIKNRMEDPSYEHGDTSLFWTYLNEVVDADFIQMGDDGDAAFGYRSWIATESATSANEMRSVAKAIDPTKPFIAYTHAKKESGVSRTSFIVEFLDASNAVLGSTNPAYTAGAFSGLTDADLPTSYTAFGGVVWPVGSANSPALPTGTTQVRFRFIPSSLSEAVVRVDAFFFSELPSMSVTDMPDAVKWYGYFDGDQVEYDQSPGAEGYTWSGDAGDSESFGLRIARDGNLNLFITYTHPTRGNTSKTGDRLTIRERYGTDDWKIVYRDLGFIGGNRSKIPIPTGILKSERRYEFTVEAQDDIGISSQTPPLVADVRYEGPAQLNIVIARSDDDQAQVHLVFDSSLLPITQFGAIEIAKGDVPVIVDRLSDPTQTNWIDHFPLAGEPESYWVRQLEVRGVDEVAGRFDRAEVIPGYTNWWIKDVEDPFSVAIEFVVLSSDPYTTSFLAPQDSYRPWGEPLPVHITGEGRESSGSITVRFLDDADELVRPKLDMLALFIRRRRTVAFLSQRPPRVRYVTLTDIQETTEHLPYYASYELSWEETNYSLDYYERTGLIL